ncbi:MAG TPA: transporter substrate-binding domain-containing protein [Xanthobacteraceae bacterium]|nr:transporter substrate-binding domain-containing protein [Xanthobacteraceae bacterium]
MQRADPRVADLVAAGRIRVALFLPQYAKDAVSGQLRGVGTGFIAIEATHVLAARLGITARVIEYPSPKAAVAGLKSGACDVAFLGIEPSRAAELDFSPPLFQFDYTYLVPAASDIENIADADRSRVRIGFVDSHASALALRRQITAAELVGVELPEQAFALLNSAKVEALAFPRDQLLDFAARLPGSRVLSDRYGINRVGMAVRKGRAGLLAYISEFAAHAKASGFIQSMIARGDLRGFEVAAA